MLAFECVCGQPLFFDNLACLNCGREVGFDPVRRDLGPIEPLGDGLFSRTSFPDGPRFRACGHRGDEISCNWLVPSEDPEPECLSCRLTRTVPPLDRPKNAERLRALESAKRRVVFALDELELPLRPKTDESDEDGLAFDFLEALDGEPVLTGHASGLVTLNVAEADDDYREKNRENLAEPYRTLIGHIRHELGHYYWDQLIRDTSWLEPFRATFGDEREDYQEALRRNYAEGPPPDWRQRFISSYAATHPWENWAESWAHYLHLRATLETATSFRLDTAHTPLRTTPFTKDVLWRVDANGDDERFLDWINAWVVLTAVLNEVSRSMGQPDIYPFVMNAPAVTKIHFIHCVLKDHRGFRTSRIPDSLAAPSPESTPL